MQKPAILESNQAGMQARHPPGGIVKSDGGRLSGAYRALRPGVRWQQMSAVGRPLSQPNDFVLDRPLTCCQIGLRRHHVTLAPLSLPLGFLREARASTTTPTRHEPHAETQTH